MFATRVVVLALIAGICGSGCSAEDTAGGCKSQDPAVALAACTADIETASPGSPELAAAYHGRGMAHILQFSASKAKIDDDAQSCLYEQSEASIAACSRIIDNPAADAELRSSALFYRSKQLSTAGRGADAISDFQKTLAPLPPADLTDMKQAHADFSRALEIDPKNAVAFAQRADTDLALGDIPASLADFEKAVALDPKLMQAVFGRAIVRMGTGDPAGAAADFKTVVDLSATTEQEKWMQEAAKERLQSLKPE